MLRRCAVAITACSITIALSACGIKGPLKLPPGKAESANVPSIPSTTPSTPDVIDATKERGGR